MANDVDKLLDDVYDAQVDAEKALKKLKECEISIDDGDFGTAIDELAKARALLISSAGIAGEAVDQLKYLKKIK